MRPRINSNARREADGSQTFYYMCELKERSRLKNCQMCNVNGNVLDKLLCDEIMNFNKPSSNVGKQLDSILRQIEKRPVETVNRPRNSQSSFPKRNA